MPADILQPGCSRLVQGHCEEQFEWDTEEEAQLTCVCLHVQQYCSCCFKCLLLSQEQFLDGRLECCAQ